MFELTPSEPAKPRPRPRKPEAKKTDIQPSQGNLNSLVLRIDRDVVEEADELARDMGVSRAEVLRKGIRKLRKEWVERGGPDLARKYRDVAESILCKTSQAAGMCNPVP